jgi:hypothetical protein
MFEKCFLVIQKAHIEHNCMGYCALNQIELDTSALTGQLGNMYFCFGIERDFLQTLTKRTYFRY